MGGNRPLWAHSGKELFFDGPDGSLMRASVEASGANWRAGTPVKLLEPRYLVSGGGNVLRAYDVSADDRRFLMIEGAEQRHHDRVTDAYRRQKKKKNPKKYWFEEL